MANNNMINIETFVSSALFDNSLKKIYGYDFFKDYKTIGDGTVLFCAPIPSIPRFPANGYDVIKLLKKKYVDSKFNMPKWTPAMLKMAVSKYIRSN